MARSFSYSIIRFCPDTRRGELVNIGIAVFLNGRVDIRFTESFSKAQALYPHLSFSELDSFPGRINTILSNIGSVKQQHEILREFGPLSASELGVFEVASGDQYELQIQQLLADYVTPPRAKAKQRSKTGMLKRKISDMFRAAGVLGKTPEDIDAHKVVPSFPVSPQENLFVDFAYKNGIYRFAEIVDLRVSTGSLHDKFKECCEKAISLDKAKRKFGSDTARLVLFSAPEEYSPLIDSSLNLLGDYASKLLNADSQDDLLVFRECFVPNSLSV